MNAKWQMAEYYIEIPFRDRSLSHPSLFIIGNHCFVSFDGT